MKNIKTLYFLIVGIVLSNSSFASDITDISQNDTEKKVKFNLNLEVNNEEEGGNPLICLKMFWVVSNKDRSPFESCCLLGGKNERKFEGSKNFI